MKKRDDDRIIPSGRFSHVLVGVFIELNTLYFKASMGCFFGENVFNIFFRTK